MIRHRPLHPLPALLLGALLLAGALGSTLTAPAAASHVTIEKLGRLPLYFVENRGQVHSRVAYYVQGRDTSVYLTSKGLTFTLTGDARPTGLIAGPLAISEGPQRPTPNVATPLSPRPEVRHTLKLDFVGANPVEPVGEEKTPAVISYFGGRQEEWQTGLETFSRVAYRELWPGIDLIYSGTVNRMKYEFVLAPGADPERIRLLYRGATDLRVSAAGELEVATPAGLIKDERPYAYQEIDGKRVEVAASYALGPNTQRPASHSEHPNGRTPEQLNAHRYGFRVGEYDRSKPLILDPAVLVYAGYIGGAGAEQSWDIAVDEAGNAYVTGETQSTQATFPDGDGFGALPGTDRTSNGDLDAFVAKVTPAGVLVYASYIGGSGFEQGLGIAVDSTGHAYVTGLTRSTEATFPVAVGPDLTFNSAIGGRSDAFVVKLNPAGTGLVYAGYIGGSDDEQGRGIAVDTAGNAYVTGDTVSTQASFPDGDGFGTLSGPDVTHNGDFDAFVVKVNAAGTALEYAGYIGGAAGEAGHSVAVDGLGNAYVSGTTLSTQATFPVTVGPDLTFNGVADAFVAKVNAAGTALEYAGYIGGGAADTGIDIAVDTAGSAYVNGDANSTEATFPDGDGFGALPGPDQTFAGGGIDAFVAKVNAAGSALDYAGYVGGAGGELGRGIDVDGLGNAYVTGETASTEATFPVVVGPDLTFNGSVDAFIAKVNAAGTALEYAGYIGGAGVDVGLGVAVDGFGNAYVTGPTASTQSSFPVLRGPDLTLNGSFDAFVVKIGEPGQTAGGRLKVKRRITLGAAKRGITSKPKSLLISNTSRSEDLQVTITPPPAPFAIVAGGGTVTIGPRGHHVVRLSFTPPAKGQFRGTLQIDSSDSSNASVPVELVALGR